MDQNNQILKLLTEEFSSFSIDINNYRKLKLIGKGGYAEVWLGENIDTNEQVALKQLYPTLTLKQVRSFAREIRTMSYGNHPFFVKFIGFSSTSCLTLVSEYMPNGSLFRFLRSEHRRKRLTGTHRTLIAMGIAHAMNYLHNLGIIHRDLKSMNILLDSKYLPRLCDFGIARFLDPTQVMTTHIGTPHWMAPEILSGNKYGKEVDVYSFAMLMYELMTNLIPWAGLEPATVIKQVCTDNLRPKLPPETPEQIRKLIHLCWSKSPDKRPTFANIYHIFKTGQAAFPDTDQNEIKKLDKKLKKFDLLNKSTSYSNKSPSSPQMTVSPIPNMKNNPQNLSSPVFDNENKNKNRKKSAAKNQYDSYGSDDVSDEENSPPRPSSKSKKQIKGNKQNNQKSPSNKFTAEVIYDEFTETEETNSMILKQDTNDIEKKDNRIKLSEDSVSPINLDVLQDPKNPQFFEEMQKAIKSLSKTQSKEFFTIIGNFFNSKSVDDTTLKKILEYLLPILSNRHAVTSFAELELQLKLPLSNRSDNDILFFPCMNILIKLFSENPWIFQNNFNDQMVNIIKKSPSKAIILLAHFAKASQNLENCWDLLDLMIRHADLFLNDTNNGKNKNKSKKENNNLGGSKFTSSREFISILYNLCVTNKGYKNYRLQHCLNVFQKGIESEDPETVCLSYNSMSEFFSDSMEFDLSLLIKHLKMEATAKSCLSILIRMKHIPRCQPIVNALLNCALKYEEATFCLIRIALKFEGAEMIISQTEESTKSKNKNKESYDSDGSNKGQKYNFQWIQSELPSYENTFKLFLSVFFHTELRIDLIMSKYTANLFNALFKTKNSDFLTAFSVVIQSVSTDEVSSEDIDLLSKRKLFINFIDTANEIRDESSVEAIIDVVRHISNVQFVPEFTSVFELILETQFSSNSSQQPPPKITQRAIQMFAAASEWQSASRKMKKLGVDKIVREKFSDDSKMARYTKKLLANIQ
ncbi:hypothetical protein M9Y10_021089 [Tritrichomonas musculus]|uniref:Protein kinase domain-containing protein n=1 Tax=Tritrichomonas musculus TaxID=1915356 RepID=A0ABR2HD19_9EUKA